VIYRWLMTRNMDQLMFGPYPEPVVSPVSYRGHHRHRGVVEVVTHTGESQDHNMVR